MSVYVIILPLRQPFKKLQETISSSARIYKQSLLNSLKKETDSYADAQTLKKKSVFKNRIALPYRSKTIQKIFLKLKHPNSAYIGHKLKRNLMQVFEDFLRA